MTESANKEDRSPLYNRMKATKRMTEAYHENNRKPPCSNKKTSCAMAPTAQHFSLYTFHFSFPTGKTFHFALFTFHFRRTHFSFPTGRTFHFSLFTFHFHKRELPYITPIQCSTYGARMAVKMPLRVRPSEA